MLHFFAGTPFGDGVGSHWEVAMQLGRLPRLALGLGLCVGAMVVAAVTPHGGSEDRRTLLLEGHDVGAVTESEAGGSLVASISWTGVTGDLDQSDICVVIFDGAGEVVSKEGNDSLAPIPDEPAAGRWTADGLDAGTYTVYIAQCATPATNESVWVVPQFLGGGDDLDAATWVEVADGSQVDLGTIALHGIGSECHRNKPALGLRQPVHLVLRRLRTRTHDQLVDVHVRWPGGDPGDGIGDVLGTQRVGDTGVDGVGPLVVAGEPDQRELVGPHHAGSHLAHADRLVEELEPEGFGHRLGAVLRRRVAAARPHRPPGPRWTRR